MSSNSNRIGYLFSLTELSKKLNYNDTANDVESTLHSRRMLHKNPLLLTKLRRKKDTPLKTKLQTNPIVATPREQVSLNPSVVEPRSQEESPKEGKRFSEEHYV